MQTSFVAVYDVSLRIWKSKVAIFLLSAMVTMLLSLLIEYIIPSIPFLSRSPLSWEGHVGLSIVVGAGVVLAIFYDKVTIPSLMKTLSRTTRAEAYFKKREEAILWCLECIRRETPIQITELMAQKWINPNGITVENKNHVGKSIELEGMFVIRGMSRSSSKVVLGPADAHGKAIGNELYLVCSEDGALLLHQEYKRCLEELEKAREAAMRINNDVLNALENASVIKQ